MKKNVSVEQAKQLARDTATIAVAATIDPGRYVDREEGEELADWCSRARRVATEEYLKKAFLRTEEEIMKPYRTSCCKAKHKGLSRVNWVCEECGKNVSMEVILFFDCMATEEEKQ